MPEAIDTGQPRSYETSLLNATNAMKWPEITMVLKTHAQNRDRSLPDMLGAAFLVSSGDLQLGACYYLFKHEDYKSCNELLEWILSTSPHLADELKENLMYLKADAFLSSMEFKAAIEVYSRLIHWRPTDIAHANRALAHWELGNYQDALADYLAAIAIDPDDNAIAHRGAGEMLAKIDRISEAIGHFERAIFIDDQYVAAHRSLGIAYFNCGEIDKSYVALKRVLAIAPDDDVARLGLKKIDAILYDE